MSKTVLIIEDNKQDADMLKEHISKLGLKAHVSMSGEDGLKRVREIKPDLVLLDLILPDIDGFDVCEQIKQDKQLSATKVIIISVKADVEKIGKALHINADEYIVKTLVGEVPDDLTDKINLQLGLQNP